MAPRARDRSNIDIARRRVANQRLVGAPFDSALDVVRYLGAVQAQDYSGAKWALAQRVRDGTDAAIERVVAEGAIIRTHVLRPTWHFVLPADVRWMLALTGPRIAASLAHNSRRLELDAPTFRRATDAMARALEGGRHLTRSEIAKVLTRARVDCSDGIRVGFLLMHAELDAVICSGARRGKQITYALLDERVPAAPTIDRDEALARLARIYFSTRAPATVYDFAWWSGLTVSDARRGLEAAGTLAEQGRTKPTRSVHLLPNYDELFIGYRDRRAALARLTGSNRLQGSAAVFGNVIEIDGQLVGGWRRIAKGRSFAIETTYFAPVTAAERKAVNREVARYEAFLGGNSEE